jgi:hypothetical protein
LNLLQICLGIDFFFFWFLQFSILPDSHVDRLPPTTGFMWN